MNCTITCTCILWIHSDSFRRCFHQKQSPRYHFPTCNSFFKLDDLEMLACTFVIDKVKHKLQLCTDNFHSCLQCSFQNLLGCYHSEKLERGHRVCQQNLQMEKLPKYSEFLIFIQFFRSCCIYLHKWCRTEILMQNGSTISWNCITASQVKNCSV